MKRSKANAMETADPFTGLEEIYLSLLDDPRVRNSLQRRSIQGKFPGGLTADDIISESFERLVLYAWKSGQQDPEELLPYFIRICQNMINKLFNREGTKEQPLQESTLDKWVVEGEDFEEEWLGQEERDRLLWEAVDQLDERCQNFLLMRFKENLSSKEIAIWTEELTYKQVDRIMDKCRAKYRRLIKNVPQFFPLTQYLKTAK
ncbi:MAG: sigma-70 family RNA polymerase sigma factor [Bacteroidota bacterium]